MPEMLRLQHPEWRGESLDGIFVERAVRPSIDVLELVGTCILMTDQSVTPIFVAIGVSASRDKVRSFVAWLGEPGGGHLGISGPPCNSERAARLNAVVSARFDLAEIQWVYRLASGDIGHDAEP